MANVDELSDRSMHTSIGCEIKHALTDERDNQLSCGHFGTKTNTAFEEINQFWNESGQHVGVYLGNTL